jgi:hypothetical protein
MSGHEAPALVLVEADETPVIATGPVRHDWIVTRDRRPP